jgi:hypothetical protein
VRVAVTSTRTTAVEFAQVGDKTKLTLTEHGMYLDGEDQPSLRFEGISGQLDALGPWLAGTANP